jgi:hypothetical protein
MLLLPGKLVSARRLTLPERDVFQGKVLKVRVAGPSDASGLAVVTSMVF